MPNNPNADNSDNTIDRSAGEPGKPADMEYYRTQGKEQNQLVGIALILPLLLVLLIVAGALYAIFR